MYVGNGLAFDKEWRRLLREILSLGLEDRRNADRREVDRGTPDRRRLRRRRTIRGVIFGMAAMALPTPTPTTASIAASRPRELTGHVAVSTTGFHAVPAHVAYEGLIVEASRRFRLDPNLIRAVIRAESAFHPFAVSRAGALGLMQLMPEVAEELGVTDPFDPRENIFGGALYLRRLLDHHRGNIELAVASYNAGPTAVERYRGIPPYPETRRYVKTVTRTLAKSRNKAGD